MKIKIKILFIRECHTEKFKACMPQLAVFQITSVSTSEDSIASHWIFKFIMEAHFE